MKVYLATSGSYSDYRVVRVFLNKEDADAYPLKDYVEEFDLHEGPVETRPWYVLKWFPDEPDGEHVVESTNNGHYHSCTLVNPREMYARHQDYDGHPNRLEHRWLNGRDSGCLWVEGWEEERVRKVYGELRAEWLNNKSLGMEWDRVSLTWKP